MKDFETRLADHTLNLLLNGLLQPADAPRSGDGSLPEGSA